MNGSIIYLVGFMGAGKTEVGRRLAELLGWPFVDLDLEIEKCEGMPIPEIFQRRGEAYFRELERNRLQRVSEGRNAVVAVGGGGCCSTANQEVIERTGISVWLDAPLETLCARCSGSPGSRPLFASMEVMAQLLESRRPFYARARLHLQVAGRSVDDLAQQILQSTEVERTST